MNNVLNKNIIKVYLVSILIAFLFLLIFSISTSIIGAMPTLDSSIFQVIGKYWAQGVVPYIGLWDSKGPLIFFVNALGYSLTNSSSGVFFIQVLSLSITTYFTYSFFRKSIGNNYSWLLTIIVLIGLANCYESGNSVEEYLLPLIIPSFFYMYKWSEVAFTKNQYEHAPRYALMYGLVLAFSLLTRLTNAVGICAGTFIIIIVLALNRNWKNLFTCALSFIFGFSLLVIPFSLYFYSKGALYDMWYGTLLYNIEYSGNSSSVGFSTSIYAIISHLLAYSSSFFLIAVSLIVIYVNKERRKIGLFWLFVSALTYFYFYHTYKYNHYSIIALAYYCIGVIELIKLYKITSIEYLKQSIRYSLSVFSLLLVFGCCYQIYQVINYRLSPKNDLADYKQLISQIPSSELNSFVGYNTEALFYLKFNLKPYYRFFCIQDWAASNGNSLLPKLKETFDKGNAKWILIKSYGGPCGIQDIIDKRYKEFDKKDNLLLYRLDDYR